MQTVVLLACKIVINHAVLGRVPGLAQKDYLVNRVMTKNEGPLGEKLHKNREIAVEQAVGVWVHRDS